MNQPTPKSAVCPFGYGAGAVAATDGAAPLMEAAAQATQSHTGKTAPAEGWHDAQLDFSASMSYGDYLALDQILEAQHPRSPDHNEMLFIIQHQTSELWMRLMLVELHAALDAVKRDALQESFKMLARVSRIFEQLVTAWNVLSTLTPSEYSAMRPYLEASSGFQSFQYRQIEFLLGNKNARMLQPHSHHAARYEATRAVLYTPSFYDEVVRLLARRGFRISASRLERDWTQATVADSSVEAAWLQIYREPDAHWELYQMGEELVDLEDAFRQWRFRHVTTVERVIGAKQGTGGTNGAQYLRKMLDTVLFPELWSVRTQL